MMRNVLFVAVLALCCLVAGDGFRGPAEAADDAGAGKTPYVHVVIFYLKKDAPANAAEGLIADAHAMLKKVPTVRAIQAGRPAEMSTPKLAKTDYQVGLLVHFDNYEGLKTYMDHELHTEYVKRHGDNIDMDKLLVFDFINQKK